MTETLAPSTGKRRRIHIVARQSKRNRIHPTLELPEGVRVGKSLYGLPEHQFLQPSGDWRGCGGTGACRECDRTKDTMSIEERVRDALIYDYGPEAVERVGRGDNLIGVEGFGDGIEIIGTIEAEFGAYLTPVDADPPPDLSIELLVAAVDIALQKKKAPR